MLKVGLTGGLGCGKSTVAGLFIEFGVPVYDADEIARELVEPGRPAFMAIAEAFGEGILEQGRLNRTKLRERIYSNPTDKLTLETIIHPLVFESMAERAATLQACYCIFAIPLLIESGRRDFVDRILVVDCLPNQQYERVRRRDRLDDTAIRQIIEAQAARQDRLSAADAVIENTGEMGLLREQVNKLHESYLLLAKKYP